MELGQNVMIVDGEDVARWIREENWDILSLIDPCMKVTLRSTEYISCPDLVFKTGGQCKNCAGGDIENPKEGSQRCIFLHKVRGKPYYRCEIQETKPNHCSKWEVGKWKHCATLKGDQRK